MDDINKEISQTTGHGAMVVLKVGGKAAAKKLNEAFKKLAEAGKLVISPQYGKQTLNSMMKSKDALSNIELTGERIPSFDKIAKKYGIAYSVMQDKQSEGSGTIKPDFTGTDYTSSVQSQQAGKCFIYFKAKDADRLDAAFREYTAQQLKAKKPSVNERINKIKNDLAKNRTKDLTKNAVKSIEKVVAR